MRTVSIVIPMRNEADILERCLHAMEELDYPRDLLEIVIVNDGSTDNTAELIEKGSWSFNYQYIETDGVGVSRARDMGFSLQKKAIQYLLLEGFSYPGFELEAEMFSRFSKAGFKIVEVPISYGRRFDEPKLSSLFDGFKIFRALFSGRLRLKGV
ncbi:glycosyltransferase family 2 protein [Methanothermobacter sp. THM-2]|uniref:Glycosyltransferase 2-like domain-containing protein n=1 Tax=Methanothermobacter tenebrarum TaxID=680118 RepID=A0ABM7YF85_9EURY|nr:glycosyltransferase [Methanothermobacter sp. THM-2]QHN08743.1 glycosyltransferase [Methanothermobacter sp. THM-2]BDH79966.1 hypothetical protein MTTB_13450 [Methanothermobacter tenebrarum]SCM56821.1 putative glycosyltransferase {ECO:0000313/EMBL:ADL58356,1} [Methanothermobacter wolfeii]